MICSRLTKVDFLSAGTDGEFWNDRNRYGMPVKQPHAVVDQKVLVGIKFCFRKIVCKLLSNELCFNLKVHDFVIIA